MTEPTLLQLRVAATLLAALVAAGLAAYCVRRRRAARAIGDRDLLLQLLGTDLSATPWARVAAVGLATAALAIALLDPSLATAPPLPRGPVVLLLDASGSMLVEDVEPRRLEVQRDFARALATRLPDAPVGIVAFSGRAFTLTPPTRDGGSIEMYLATLDPTIVTQTGSALGAAIRQGVGLLVAGEGPGGTIVLLGDGDETEDRAAAEEAATLAGRRGVRLHTVAVGTAQGGPVPALDLARGVLEGYLRDAAGELLISGTDDAFLADLARRTGGIHVNASEAGALELLVEEIRGSRATRDESDRGGLPRYVWFAGLALLLLVLEPLAPTPGRPR